LRAASKVRALKRWAIVRRSIKGSSAFKDMLSMNKAMGSSAPSAAVQAAPTAKAKAKSTAKAKAASEPPEASTSRSVAVPPPPAPAVVTGVLLKVQLDAWWPWASGRLRALIVKSDFQDDEKWAASMIKFIGKGLAACRWITEDSEIALDVTTRDEYLEEYGAKLGDRKDVPTDNLWRLKSLADEALKREASKCVGVPMHIDLINALYDKREALKWSQGGFGPSAYHSDFLKSYANAMLSDSWFTQPQNRYGETYAGQKRPLECGIFYLVPGTEYPLHYHNELEAYYILAGKTRFVWMHDDKLIYLDREAGQWHFNPPNLPHAITTPHGEPHLSLWFREGGSGQEANNKFGPKWIADVDGLDFIGEDDEDGVADGVYTEETRMVGSLGFKKGCVFRDDCKKAMRLLTPSQFEYLNNDESVMAKIDEMLDPEMKKSLEQTTDRLRAASKVRALKRWAIVRRSIKGSSAFKDMLTMTKAMGK